MKNKIYHLVILTLFIFSGRSFAQSSYTQDFSAGLPAGANGGTSYSLSVVNQELVVVVNKSTPWEGFQVGTTGNLDLSNVANQTFSFDIRTDTTVNDIDFNIMVQPFANSSPTSNFKLITASSKYRRVSFSFASISVAGMNWATVTGFQIVVQPRATYSGTLFFDNIAVGAAATNLPYFKGIQTQYAFINSTNNVIKIQQPLSANIYNQQLTFSAVSSNPGLIPSFSFNTNPVPSSTLIPFTSANGTPDNVWDGRTVLMTYSPVAGQSGMATVTVTAITTNTIAGVTLSPSAQVFTIVVNKNIAPVIGGYPSSIIVGSDVTSAFNLDRISSGNGEVSQLMTITGTSDNQSVIQDANIKISFTGIGSFAQFSVKPVLFASLPVKTCNISFTIKDNGGTAVGGVDQSVIVIPVTVYPTVYNSPVFDPIANRNNLISDGPQQITITGIKDGNGAADIGSLNAVSSNTAIMANPTIRYFKGDNYAILSYNISNVGNVVISVTAINAGAPANSNGNTAFTSTFNIVGILPPVNGYIEDFSSPSAAVVTKPSYGTQTDWATNNPPSKWYSETDGNQLTTTVNTTTSTVNVAVNKFGLTYGNWFAGLWYKPDPINTYNFAAYPYLSVKLSATYSGGDAAFNPNLPVAIDLWDVNGKRYGLSSYVSVGPSESTYTFCYNGTPSDAGFDFTKIKMILFNFPALGNGGAFINKNYSGNVTIRDIRLGDQALGAGSCPGNTPLVKTDPLFAWNYLTTQSGPKTITITGINAGTSPISGFNANPVTLSVNSTGLISPVNLSAVTNGRALLTFNTPASAGVTNITITGSATGSTTTRSTFQIIVSTIPSSMQVVINNDVNATHPDGVRGQTMDGFGATLQSNVGGGDTPLGYQPVNQTVVLGVMDQGVTMARMGIPPNFESLNDNSDPNVINFSAFDMNSLSADLYLAYSAAGVQKFIGSCWSTPSWTKLNKSTSTPQGTSYFADNTIDTAYIQEIAEFFTAYVLALKQKTGIEIYAIDLDNEPQFNEPYTSSQINPQQFILVMNAMVTMFNKYGLKTLVFGPETLGQDNNVYIAAIAADPVGQNNLSAHARHNYAPDGVAAGSLTWGPILAATRDARLNGGKTRYLNNPLTSAGSTGNGGIGIPVWQTETSGYSADWTGALSYGSAMQSAINYGNVSAWTFWNYAGTDLSDSYSQITPQGPIQVYYAQKHFSKYVYPGAVRVPAALSSTTGVFVSAFQNAASSKYGSSLVTVLTNSNSSWASVSLTGTSLPTAFRVFQSYEGSYWLELATTAGVVNLPPNSMTTLWGNGTSFVAATSVVLTIPGGNATISSPGGTVSVIANVLPLNVPDATVVWTVSSITGNASIDPTGVLTALSNGTVLVKATSVNTPSVFGTLVVTLTGQIPKVLVTVTGLTITGNLGMNTITTPGGGLAMIANIAPGNASNSAVNWSVSPSNKATISNLGFLTSLNRGDGVVTVTGVSVDGGFSSSYVVTISNQSIHMQSLTLYDPSGNNSIDIRGATLELGITILPANTSNEQKVINFTVLTDGSGGMANVVGNGIVTAVADGIVTIVGTSFYDPTITGILVLTISGQKAFTGITSISTPDPIRIPGGSITLTGAVLNPGEAVDSLVWTFDPPTTLATSVKLTTLKGAIIATDAGNGSVTVVGVSKLNPSIVSSKVVVFISGQTSALGVHFGIDGVGDADYIGPITASGINTPTAYATFMPDTNAYGFLRNNYMAWSSEPSGIVDIGTDGVIKGIGNGTAVITGTYGRNPFISNTKTIVVNDPTLSIDNNLIDNLAKIYPNPAKGIVNIEISTELGSTSVSVYNTLGGLILSKKIDTLKSSLDLSGLPDGLYNFVIATPRGVTAKQIVVIH